MTFSLEYQKTLNTRILDVHRRAGSHTDPHVCLGFLFSFFKYLNIILVLLTQEVYLF